MTKAQARTLIADLNARLKTMQEQIDKHPELVIEHQAVIDRMKLDLEMLTAVVSQDHHQC